MELPELVSWLTDSVENDRDVECRQLARANLVLLKELVGDPFEGMFKDQANTARQTSIRTQSELPLLKF